MDGRTNGQTDRQPDGWTDGQMERRSEKQTDRSERFHRTLSGLRRASKSQSEHF